MDDLISRKAVIDKAITIPIAKIVTEDKVIYRRIVFVEDIENLPHVQPEVGTCKTCDCQKSCKHAQYLGNDGYCSRWERRTDETD